MSIDPTNNKFMSKKPNYKKVIKHDSKLPAVYFKSGIATFLFSNNSNKSLLRIKMEDKVPYKKISKIKSCGGKTDLFYFFVTLIFKHTFTYFFFLLHTRCFMASETICILWIPLDIYFFFPFFLVKSVSL